MSAAADISREGLRAVLLDAGNTVVFLDMEAICEIVAARGVTLEASALWRAEAEAKRRYEALLARDAPDHEAGWTLYMATLLEAAGVPNARARELVPSIRASHDGHNLWRRVPAGLPDALDRLRAAGLATGIVSNSEGGIGDLLAEVGLASRFDVIVDSHLEGVAKPDPEIFRRAVARLGVRADEAIHAGDVLGVDVVGARAAGLAAVLVDPRDDYPHLVDVARVSSVVELVARLLG